MAPTHTPGQNEPVSEAEVSRLSAEYEEAIRREAHKDRDCHWRILQRWSYGEHAGWFVEHQGYLYKLEEGESGVEGPYPNHEQALAGLAKHLRAAIADARSFEDD